MPRRRPIPSERLRAVCVLLLVFAAGCGGCDEVRVSDGQSIFVAKPVSLNFGRVFIGNEEILTVTLRADGDIPVNYRAAFSGDAFGYLAGPASARVLAGDTAELEVTFRPGREGEAKTEMVLTHDGSNPEPVLIELRGVGVPIPDCEDGNVCTVDRFDLEAERCVHSAESILCDDFDACTTNDQCFEGVCLGASFSCDDNDPCTDDFCDPAVGCLHELTVQCDDGNPCTTDSCTAQQGCEHDNKSEGTPCNDGEQCTQADICILGSCRGVAVPEGSPCDDLDPCSKDDQCVEGVCQDPNYESPRAGEIKFSTPVGPLAPRASENPIIDGESTTYAGTVDGVVAVDVCGDILWNNDQLGTPRWSAAVSRPGRIFVPVGSRLVGLRVTTGELDDDLDLSELFDPTGASTTATVTVRIVDLAVRASGTIVASLSRRVDSPEPSFEGLIAEIDRDGVASVLRPLGQWHANRLAIDRDEAVVAVLGTGDPDAPFSEQRLVRFGIDNLLETSWATSATTAIHTEIAIGFDGRVFWTDGILAVDRDGRSSQLIPPEPTLANSGSPLVVAETIYWVKDLDPTNVSQDDYALVATSSLGVAQWATPLETTAVRMSPVVDSQGSLFVLGSDGILRGISRAGQLFLETSLNSTGTPGALTPAFPWSHASVAISFEGTLTVIGDGRVIGVEYNTLPSGAPWPRHRRDNLSTGHR